MTLSTLDLWMLLFPWVIAPAGAVVAGGVTWFLTRDETPSAGELVRHFVVSMAMVWLLAGGLLAGDWAHRLLDARTQYLPLARRLLPHSEDDGVLVYMQALVPVLRELRNADPVLCVGYAWPAAGGRPIDLQSRIGADAARAYQDALVALIVQASTRTPAQPRPVQAAGSNPLQEMQRAYAEIRDSMEPAHGRELMRQLHTREVREFDATQACEASIELLERTLALPPQVARRLGTAMLRT